MLRVLQSGVLATVQDLGRPDAQRWGVPVGGAMDHFALQAGNKLVGNAPDHAALEITAGGAALEITTPTLLAITGGDLGATLDGEQLPLWTAVWARQGSELRFAGRSGGGGARAYVVVAGGIDVPVLLGSRSTCLPGAFGGLSGRPLRAGDILHTGAASGSIVHAGRHWPVDLRPRYAATPALRILPGPHRHLFAPDALDLLQALPFMIDASSNRIGYRLQGATLRADAPDLPSLPVFPGVVQVPPDGTPILLMADAQPTGGYPIIAVVIAADLPLAAQLLPGDALHFELIEQDDAIAAWRKLHGWLQTDLSDDEIMALLGWAGG